MNMQATANQGTDHQASDKWKVVIPSEPKSPGYTWVAAMMDIFPDLEVKRVPLTGATSLHEMAEEQPDWVILIGEAVSYTYQPTLNEIFSAAPHARVILLCQKDSTVHIYRQEVVAARSFSDLMTIMRRRRRRKGIAMVTPSADRGPPQYPGERAQEMLTLNSKGGAR